MAKKKDAIKQLEKALREFDNVMIVASNGTHPPYVTTVKGGQS